MCVTPHRFLLRSWKGLRSVPVLSFLVSSSSLRCIAIILPSDNLLGLWLIVFVNQKGLWRISSTAEAVSGAQTVAEASWAACDCLHPLHATANPLNLSFNYWKKLFKYQTVPKRQAAWDCIKGDAIFSLWKRICFSKMLFKLIFAFQSHRAAPGYAAPYRFQSARQAVLFGMLCLLIGRISSAREGMISNKLQRRVLCTLDILPRKNI